MNELISALALAARSAEERLAAERSSTGGGENIPEEEGSPELVASCLRSSAAASDTRAEKSSDGAAELCGCAELKFIEERRALEALVTLFSKELFALLLETQL